MSTCTTTRLEMLRGSEHFLLTPIILDGIMGDTTLIVVEWGVLSPQGIMTPHIPVSTCIYSELRPQC